MADELCGRTLGEFVLGEKFAEGGCGDLYRCSQPSLKREAVIKVLREARRGDDEAERRFMREAQLASRLDHHYAAHVYAFGVENDGLRWIAMELVPGVTLDQWLRSNGAMSLDQFVPLFECIAEVVHAAHTCGIVHRDLKASNVMVIERAGRLVPKLLDFGIAKLSSEDPAPASSSVPEDCFSAGEPAAGDAVTRTGSGGRDRITPPHIGIGSAAYMSPEQWDNLHAAGSASDIYSLGVLAYRALAGRLPFTAQTRHEWRQQHFAAEVPALGGDLPPVLDQILQRALAKTPAGRQHSAIDLASDFRVALMASERAMLRSLAQQWDARARSPSLLLSGDVLAGVERWTRRAPSPALSDLECSFVAASHRRARHSTRVRRLLVAAAVATALGAVAYRSALRTRMAEDRAAMQMRMADQIATEAEVEQGRQALLHGESSEAVRHLEQAYQRGERSAEVAFMLARALQPRMSELARFNSRSGRMWSAVFAPDGKRVLTADDKSARMWDATSSQLLFEMSHGDTVYRALFSHDGSKIITAGGDGTVRIWSAATGAPIRELRSQWPSVTRWRYYAVAMSMHSVAAIDLTGKSVHVWDADTGQQIAALDNDAPGASLLAFSADGHWLATSGRDEVRVFDTSSWRQVATVGGPRVRSLGFDPSGPRLAVGTNDGVAAIWEIPSGRRVRGLRDAGASVDAVAFSHDGTLVAAASRDGMEQVWDVSSGSLRTQFNSHRNRIYAVEFSAAGDLLLSAGAEGAIVISNVSTGMAVTRLEGPNALVITAHFDPESRRVVGASWDGTSRVWDASSPYRRWGSPSVGAECDNEESLVPDQRFIAVSCRGHGTRVWDTARGELLTELPGVTNLSGGDDSSAFPALTTSGDRAAVARGTTVEVYALPSGQLLRTISHSAAVSAVAFAPAGHDLVSGAVDGSLLVTRDEVDSIALPTSHARIDAAAILADGRVVVADASYRLRVLDVSGSTHSAPLIDLTAPSRTRLLRPSPDGTRLITISTRGEQVHPVLWDLDQRRLVARLDGYEARVFAARFVARGHEALTASSDGTLRLWDAATGRLLKSFHGGSHSLIDAALAPDGSLVVAGGGDGSLRFWDAASTRLLWTLQAHESAVVGVHYEGSELVTRGISGDIARWALPPPGGVIETCNTRTCTSGGAAKK
jgi:WD40 repeat protein/serine/threonine protein kinase